MSLRVRPEYGSFMPQRAWCSTEAGSGTVSSDELTLKVYPEFKNSVYLAGFCADKCDKINDIEYYINGRVQDDSRCN